MTVLAGGCRCAPGNGGRPGGGAAGSSGTTVATAARALPAGNTVRAAIDGKPLVLRSILAYSRGGRALQLSFSDRQLGCSDLRPEGTVRESGEHTFDITLAKRLAPDGSRGWHITRSRVGQLSRQGDLGRSEVPASDPRKLVRAEVALALVNPAAAGQPARSLQLGGMVVATGCGQRKVYRQSDVRPQRELQLRVAGEEIAVRGATLSGDGDGLALILSSEPHACGGAVGVDLSLRLQIDRKTESVRAVRLGGYDIPREVPGQLEPGAIAARIEGSPDGPTARLHLAGSASIGGYRIELGGSATAGRCE